MPELICKIIFFLNVFFIFFYKKNSRHFLPAVNIFKLYHQPKGWLLYHLLIHLTAVLRLLRYLLLRLSHYWTLLICLHRCLPVLFYSFFVQLFISQNFHLLFYKYMLQHHLQTADISFVQFHNLTILLFQNHQVLHIVFQYLLM